MATLEDYEMLVAIMETGSLTAAARRLGRSLQSVSRSLGLLERDLGVTLIRRTTRRLQPTPAGVTFHHRLRGALADIAAAREELAESGAEIAGPLRIGASTLFATAYIVPVAATFLERHPAVTIELVLSDDYADPIGSGVDLTIRIGDLPDSSLVARRLASFRRVVFAAPGYLAKHGRPDKPADLKRHRCILRTAAQAPQRWAFRIEGDQRTIAVSGRFAATGADACNQAVALGLGLGAAPLWQIRPLLDAGRVELLLTEFEPEPVPVHAIWPSASALPTRTRIFVDTLAARLATVEQ